MIKCPYCESAVSEFANTCPNCGKAISKESVQESLEKQKNNSIEKVQKRKLSELGKEKYIPLVMFIAYVIFMIVTKIQALYIVHDTVGGGVAANTGSGAIIYVIIVSAFWLILPLSFVTRIYQSSRGYIFRNIQMVIDVWLIIGTCPLATVGEISRGISALFIVANVFLWLTFVVSFILCIRMKKQNIFAMTNNVER